MSDPISYSAKEAAKAICVSPSTIWRLMAAGDLASFKLGGRTLIRAEALRALIDKAATPDRPPTPLGADAA
ncbi:MAG: helix-turn-helix domain-containing protein [Candidatus Dormibacteria bacterium]